MVPVPKTPVVPTPVVPIPVVPVPPVGGVVVPTIPVVPVVAMPPVGNPVAVPVDPPPEVVPLPFVVVVLPLGVEEVGVELEFGFTKKLAQEENNTLRANTSRINAGSRGQRMCHLLG
jgi:hypothetical protein